MRVRDSITQCRGAGWARRRDDGLASTALKVEDGIAAHQQIAIRTNRQTRRLTEIDRVECLYRAARCNPCDATIRSSATRPIYFRDRKVETLGPGIPNGLLSPVGHVDETAGPGTGERDFLGYGQRAG